MDEVCKKEEECTVMTALVRKNNTEQLSTSKKVCPPYINGKGEKRGGRVYDDEKSIWHAVDRCWRDLPDSNKWENADQFQYPPDFTYGSLGYTRDAFVRTLTSGELVFLLTG